MQQLATPTSLVCLYSSSSLFLLLLPLLLLLLLLSFHHLAITGVPTIVNTPLAGPVTAVIHHAAATSPAPSGITLGSTPQEVNKPCASRPFRTPTYTVDKEQTYRVEWKIVAVTPYTLTVFFNLSLIDRLEELENEQAGIAVRRSVGITRKKGVINIELRTFSNNYQD